MKLLEVRWRGRPITFLEFLKAVGKGIASFLGIVLTLLGCVGIAVELRNLNFHKDFYRWTAPETILKYLVLWIGCFVIGIVLITLLYRKSKKALRLFGVLYFIYSVGQLIYMSISGDYSLSSLSSTDDWSLRAYGFLLLFPALFFILYSKYIVVASVGATALPSSMRSLTESPTFEPLRVSLPLPDASITTRTAVSAPGPASAGPAIAPATKVSEKLPTEAGVNADLAPSGTPKGELLRRIGLCLFWLVIGIVASMILVTDGGTRLTVYLFTVLVGLVVSGLLPTEVLYRIFPTPKSAKD